MNEAFKANPDLKILFICSPGNPTGTLIPLPAIKRVLENPDFTGVVVVDEAYIDFTPEGSSAASLVNDYGNVCVSQTLSKGFGLCAIRYVQAILLHACMKLNIVRLGFLLAPPPLIQILTNTKAPYNISTPTASVGLAATSPAGLGAMQRGVDILNHNRGLLLQELKGMKGIGAILGGNHANFVLAQVVGEDGKPDNRKAAGIYKTMAESLGVVVRFRGNEKGCEGCLRITVGTEGECRTALEKLRELL